MARILVVEDDEGVRSFLVEALALGRHEVAEAQSGEEAVLRLQQQDFDLMITDLQMPGQGGMVLLEKARTRWPSMGALVLTAFGTPETALDAFKLGVHGFIRKPVESPEVLRHLVRRALIRAKLVGY